MPRKKNSGIDIHEVAHPVVYEINTRLLLRELSTSSKKPITLATLPDALLDQWTAYSIDAVWLMGVWDAGPLGITIARANAGLEESFRAALPDYTEKDVIGSPYAVHAYEVSGALGGDEGLAKLRARLADRGIGLLLDFVPNHTARDHPWVAEHPEYYVMGVEGEEREKRDLYFCVKTKNGERTLAYGRDPGFPGWTDTAQLNPLHPGARAAMITTLKRLAGMCDGVRCDMAMLVLTSVFERTWGERAKPVGEAAMREEFWRDAIMAVRAVAPNFMFIAESYWSMEWELQQLGFDFTYDKTLYDRLLREGAGSVRDHLRAEIQFQNRSLRFIENHDEQRAAQALPSDPWHCAAATVIATVPGMVLFHEGQFEGRTVRIPVQLGRRPVERIAQPIRSFYTRLLSVIAAPVFQRGAWRLLMPRFAWHENHTWQNFLVFWWHDPNAGRRLVIVNYAPHTGQAYVDVPLDDIKAGPVEFRDLMGDAVYMRDVAGLASKGMYFDLPPYGIHIFEVGPAKKSMK